VTHKCHGTANDWALEGVKKSRNDSENVEKGYGLMMMMNGSKVIKKKAGAPAVSHHQSSFLMVRRRTTATHLIKFILTCFFPRALPIGIDLSLK